MWVEYNTNLSMLKNAELKLSVVDYWKKFSSVNIRVSIDGSGKKGEYIRIRCREALAQYITYRYEMIDSRLGKRRWIKV